MKVMAKFVADDQSARLFGVFRCFCTASRSSGTRPLRWQQAAPQQIQIRQCEGGVQPRGILRQSTVANLAKAPQALDYVKDVFDTRSSGGAATVDEPLILAQRPSWRAPIDSVADALSERSLAMRLIPVGLVAEHLALLSVQKFRDLSAIVHICRGSCEAVDDAATITANVRLHAEVPVFTLHGLAHLRISRLLLVLRRGWSGDDRRIDDRPGLQQQPPLFELGANLGKNPLREPVLLKQVAKAQDRRLVGNIVSEQFDAGEAAHRLDVVQRVLGLRVRQIKPVLHKVDAQHLLHRLWLRAVPGSRIMWLDQPQKSRPRNYCVHLGQKTLAARDLALLLPSNRGKRSLLHRSFISTAAAHCTQYRSFPNTCAELP